MGMYEDIVEMVSGHLRFEGFPDHLAIARRIVNEDEVRELYEADNDTRQNADDDFGPGSRR
jgi:hypothetical protein